MTTKNSRSGDQPLDWKYKEALKTIRKYYKSGETILESFRKKKIPVSKIAVRRSISRDVAYKAKMFAEKYTSRELDVLLKIRNTRTGMPVNWQQVIALLPETDKSFRRQLQTVAVEEGLKPAEITDKRASHAESKDASGGRPRRGGGRPQAFKKSETPWKPIRRWISMARRYCDGLLEVPQDAPNESDRVLLQILSGTDRRIVQKMAQDLSALKGAIVEIETLLVEVAKKRKSRRSGQRLQSGDSGGHSTSP